MLARRSWSSISATRDMTFRSIELIEVANFGLRNEPLAYQRAVGDATAEMRHADVEDHYLMAGEPVVDARANRHVVGRFASVLRAVRPHLGRPHAVIVIHVLAANPFGADVRRERKVAVVEGLAEVDARHFTLVAAGQEVSGKRAECGLPGERRAIPEGTIAVLHAVQDRRVGLPVSVADREPAAQCEAHAAPLADLQINRRAESMHPFTVEGNQRDRCESGAITFVRRMLDTRSYSQAPMGHIRGVAQHGKARVVGVGWFRTDTVRPGRARTQAC